MRRATAFYHSDFLYETLAPLIEQHAARCALLPPAPPPASPPRRNAWDAFYRRHGAAFFHPRSYLLSCFPLLARLAPGDLALECGAGNGSNIAALLESTPAAIAAGDASGAALAALASVPACQQALAAGRLRLFPWDVTAAALLLFTLSAIEPRQHAAAVGHLAASVALGGHVCFRDYGRGDLAQLRAPDAAILSAATHRRPDGTLAHYFETQEVAALLEGAGCTVLELAYHTVANTNRKTGQLLRRVFVHALARRDRALA
jgi:tRNAThr (cytosine32-N3)-methyltransferase